MDSFSAFANGEAYAVVLVNGYSSIRRTFDAKDRNDLDEQIAEAHPDHKLETIVSEIEL